MTDPTPQTIKTLRASAGLTQKAAAQRCSVTTRTWINWERRGIIASGGGWDLLKWEAVQGRFKTADLP
jgi:DNA-binding transcriptional regulator YiaG